MNFTFSTLQDLESLITNLFANNKCACHIINPVKTRILLWKETKNGQTIYHLRIGIQKFLSQEQTDRNGEIYWRFLNYEFEAAESTKDKELDPITKFRQRQAQTQSLNHGESNNSESSVSNHTE